jgi:hypothetical protein
MLLKAFLDLRNCDIGSVAHLMSRKVSEPICEPRHYILTGTLKKPASVKGIVVNSLDATRNYNQYEGCTSVKGIVFNSLDAIPNPNRYKGSTSTKGSFAKWS